MDAIGFGPGPPYVLPGPLTGKVFEAEVRNSLRVFGERHSGFFWMRLSDYRSWLAADKRLVAPKQPGDFLAVYQGATHLFECKSTKNPHGWNTTYLKAHQRESLNRLRDAGGRAWILLRDHSTPRHNRAWAIDIRLYERVVSSLPVFRVSVSYGMLDACGLRLPLLPGKIWDLSPVFCPGPQPLNTT